MNTAKIPKRISAVIFDLDGTLLNTLNDIAISMNIVLKQYGFSTHPIEKYRIFIGKGLANLAEQALNRHNNSDISVEEIIEKLKIEYEKRLSDTTDYYEDIPELLDYFTSKGLPMAILSNKQDYLVQKLAKIFFCKWPFKIINGTQPEFRKKPDPALAIHILKTLEVPPCECIFIGDTPADIKTAINAGMFPIGVLWGFRNKDILLEAGAEFLAHRPSEISDFITNRLR